MKKGLKIAVVTVGLSFAISSSFYAFDSIQKGAKGDEVVKIQKALIEAGYLNGDADGAFGGMTEEAVSSFQKDHGLDATGIVEESTYNAIFENSDATADDSAGANDGEIAEASGTSEAADSITFRGIDWLSPEAEVKAEVEKIEDIKPSFYQPEEENARIDSWYRQWENMYSDYNIEEAGVILRYQNVPVAGYTADLDLSFMYSIDENDGVDYDAKKAQFYMAQYDIQDVEDIEGAFDDISSKLTELYGESEDKSYYNSFDEKTSPKGKVWTASDGSLVWAGIYYNSYDEKYSTLWIVYAAPNTDGMLTELANRITQEAINHEAEQREENASNTGGL